MDKKPISRRGENLLWRNQILPFFSLYRNVRKEKTRGLKKKKIKILDALETELPRQRKARADCQIMVEWLTPIQGRVASLMRKKAS